jgi:hypothetical protein
MNIEELNKFLNDRYDVIIPSVANACNYILHLAKTGVYREWGLISTAPTFLNTRLVFITKNNQILEVEDIIRKHLAENRYMFLYEDTSSKNY